MHMQSAALGVTPEEAQQYAQTAAEAKAYYDKYGKDGMSADKFEDIATEVGALAGAGVCAAYGLAVAAPVCGAIAGTVIGFIGGTVYGWAEDLFGGDSDDLKAYKRRKEEMAFSDNWNAMASATKYELYGLLTKSLDSLFLLAHELRLSLNYAQVSEVLYNSLDPTLKWYWGPYNFPVGPGYWMTRNPYDLYVVLGADGTPSPMMSDSFPERAEEFRRIVNRFGSLAGFLLEGIEQAAIQLTVMAAQKMALVEAEVAIAAQLQFINECKAADAAGRVTPARCDAFIRLPVPDVSVQADEAIRSSKIKLFLGVGAAAAVAAVFYRKKR